MVASTLSIKIGNSFKSAAFVLSFLTIIIGILTEIGWQFNIEPLRNFFTGATSMNPVTGLCFILIGLSILIVNWIKMQKCIFLAKITGLFVIFVGFLRLEAILFGFDTHIDHFLFDSHPAINTIAPNSALCFILIGTALFFLAKDKGYKLIQVLCFVTSVTSLLAILGYFYSVTNLYGLPALTPMALNTAIAFFISSLAILFTTPDKGFMRVISADSTGGKISRILIPTIIVVPLILFKVILFTNDVGFITIKFGFSLLYIFLTACFFWITYLIAHHLDLLDFKAKLAEREATIAHLTIESAENPIFSKDLNGIIKTWNKNAQQVYGYTKQEIIGKSVSLLAPDNKTVLEMNKILENIKIGNAVTDYETVRKTKDGRILNVLISIRPLRENGVITGASVIQYDISKIKQINKTLQTTNKELEETKKAFMNIMDDLETSRNQIEKEKAKDEAMLESIGEGLIAVDNNRKISLINKSASNMLGWKENEMIGKEITSLPLADNRGNILTLDRRPTFIALSQKKQVNSTYFFIRRDKTKFPIAITVTPIVLNGKTIGAIDTFRDITKEREIDRAKSEFVSLASHQLRTPLGITKWYLEAIRDNTYFKKAPKTVTEYLDVMFKNNERVLSLVRDLLSVSRIDQGQVKNVPKQINIIDTMTNIVKELQLLAGKKDIALRLEAKQKTLPNMNIDPLRFHEVIQNLVVNAIEYTPASGKVLVTIDTNNSSVSISIKDSGIGISVADQKKLFTKFFRSEKAVSQNPEGSGLGLYVVKSYVEGWGGKIAIESKENKGTILTITLPITKIASGKQVTKRLQ